MEVEVKYRIVLRSLFATVATGVLLASVAGTASAVPPSSGAYRIVSSDNGARIIPAGFNLKDTVNVIQYRPEVHKAEVWEVTKNPNGYYRLSNANRCLQPFDGKASVDQPVQLTINCQQAKVQEWALTEPVSGRFLIAPRNNTNLVIAPETAGSPDNLLRLKERVPSHDRLWIFDTEED